jgi:hypothetical protein
MVSHVKDEALVLSALTWGYRDQEIWQGLEIAEWKFDEVFQPSVSWRTGV